MANTPYFLWLTEKNKRILLPVACIGGPIRPGPRGKGSTFVLDNEEEITVLESPLEIADALEGQGLLRIPELAPLPELSVVKSISSPPVEGGPYDPRENVPRPPGSEDPDSG